MNDQRVLKSVSGACGLSGFAVAILAGLAADNPASVILTRALIAMFVCYAVGMFIGIVAARAVREAVVTHAQRNPAPEIEEVRRTSGATRNARKPAGASGVQAEAA
ncbi:MAG: hypothetical protein H6814_08575 [Phycisphaeraceae bacterium]|nr:hypothetical protein [Phycisphaeraceae bacterium]